MAIDWEFLLDADGEDLQDAYDELCNEADDWLGDEIWEENDSHNCKKNVEVFDPVPKNLHGTCAAGEIALAASSIARRFHLRLLREITISREHNICEEEENIFSRSNTDKQCFDYLLATEEAAVLGILLTNDRSVIYDEHDHSGVPVLRVPERDMEEGNVDSIVDRLTQTLACSSPRRQEELIMPLSMRIDPIPVDFHARMAGLHMIQQREGHLWEPTAYGYSLGVREGYLPPLMGGNRPLHTLFVLETQKAKLYEAMSWSQIRLKSAGTRYAWKEIMDRVNHGLPCSDAHAVNIVRAFSTMSFADYMAPCPKEHEHLRKALGEPATYQEAADRLYRLYVESERTKEDNERLMDLIYALIRPILLTMEAMETV